MKKSYIFVIALLSSGTIVMGQTTFESDTILTSSGVLQLTFIGHGSLMFSYNDKIIHLDPVGRYADYAMLPKADLILITHHHGDHLDPEAIGKISETRTIVVCTASCLEQLQDATVMKNGDVRTFAGLTIEAVPAYNIVNKRSSGEPFHPKGVGNGYVISFGDKKIYVAGDTENIPEMADLKDIYCAFLPMNLPYTMTPQMVCDAVRLFHPAILYPYHFGDTDVNALLDLMKTNKECEIRIRKLQ